MKLLPKSLQSLVLEFARLPGVGERTALRFAVSLLKGGPRRAEALVEGLQSLRTEVSHCPDCHFWTQDNSCPICNDPSRSPARLCVVRDGPDVLALEKFRSHPWRYHVLQGLLSPLGGVGPEQINLVTLFRRVQTENVQELILAFDATVEGDATAFYIRDHFKRHAPEVTLTRTALGLPAGSSVEYLDPSTLENALTHRTSLE
jgi:recombination protein RecR